MPQKYGIFAGRSFPTTYLRNDEPIWGPLEALSTLVRQRRELPHFHPGEFMYMAGVGDARRRRIIHLYKHIDTRRYLNLDDGGHAYVYIDSPTADRRPSYSGHYRQLRTLHDALDRLDLHLFETRRLWRSFPPDQWPPASPVFGEAQDQAGPVASSNSWPRNHRGVPDARC